tara:strand:- start:102 stop:347 length:246 start_codon:yes stop_codon:yes gene_type:complete
MQSESPTGMESDLLEKVWSSDTRIRTRICTVRLERVGKTVIEIKPREIGRDTQGWSVGEQEIPVQTLEEGIIVGMEIQARG